MNNATGWRADLDEELRRYFSGVFGGEAGLRSSFGAQLDKARDGVSFKADDGPMMFLEADENGPAIWCRADLPASCVEFRRSLPVTLVEATLKGMAAVEPAALMALASFYTPQPSGAHVGLIGLQPYCEVVLYSDTVTHATKSWMARELYRELARVLVGSDRAKAATKEAIGREVERQAKLRTELTVAESGPRLCWVGKRRRLRDRVEALPTVAPAHVGDAESMVRTKWERPASRDERALVLRRIVHESRGGKDDATKGRAKTLVTQALSEATRALHRAQTLYTRARDAGASAGRRAQLDQIRSEFAWPL